MIPRPPSDKWTEYAAGFEGGLAAGKRNSLFEFSVAANMYFKSGFIKGYVAATIRRMKELE